MRNDDIDPIAIGHTCYYCKEPAESQCPTCHKFTCYEHRRDFPPDFNEHWCIDCTGKHNAIMAREGRAMTQEDVQETMEILSDPEQIAALSQGIREAEAGQGKQWGDVKRELGLE
jgi:uncharacterized protein YifE (UPF0438 family)